MAAAESSTMQHLMVEFVIQMAIIIIVARLVGSLCHRYLRLPRVLGELVAGMLIGPYALGGIDLPLLGALFPLPEAGMAVSPQLYAMATLASIILLFLAGLETDVSMFLRYSLAGGTVGLAGVVFSFLLGNLCALWFGMAESFMDPAALFLGTISTATSVGITARILSDKDKSHSPEGVTIMAAAVVDDVLGIVILAIVIGLSRYGFTGGQVPWGDIGMIAGKVLGFWLACTAVGLLCARRISHVLKISKSPATITSLALGLALLVAGLSEMVGLAMIIGAYIVGLSLSRTDLNFFLQDQLKMVQDLFVPVFFCVMGMLVDFRAMQGAVVFGLVFTVLAILAKVVGCGVPAYLAGFNRLGAWRIGLGMLPRGEVALIVASVGLTAGAIGQEIFGVSIMMTVVTTFLAPPLFYRALDGPRGLRGEEAHTEEGLESISIELPSADIAEFLMGRTVRAFREEGFFVHRVRSDVVSYRLRLEDLAFTLVLNGPELVIRGRYDQLHFARLIMLEELLALENLLESCRNIESFASMESSLAKDLFDDHPPEADG